MICKCLFLLTALIGRFDVHATSCDSDRGTCIDTSASVCSGILKTGYCPGNADVMCCEPAVECDGGNGLCIDTILQTCDGVLRSGYCAGANNIMCCEQNVTIPDECKGSGPPLPPSTYEFTLENQGNGCTTVFVFRGLITFVRQQDSAAIREQLCTFLPTSTIPQKNWYKYVINPTTIYLTVDCNRN
jgi:hypothetical protein